MGKYYFSKTEDKQRKIGEYLRLKKMNENLRGFNMIVELRRGGDMSKVLEKFITYNRRGIILWKN